MSNESNGLRFDVYERVHLPDDVAAIDELEEIELVPRIQVIDQGDQAVLKGQLLLSGVYRGQDGSGGSLTLEHWIPVEISLPMNRVSRLDDISIEIDNFDVDLLSARTLNITGVLSLRGISVDPIAEQAPQWEEESFIAVHQREPNEEETVDSEPGDREAGAYFHSVENEQEGGLEEEREITLTSRQSSEESWLQWDAEQQLAQSLYEQQAQGNDIAESLQQREEQYEGYQQTSFVSAPQEEHDPLEIQAEQLVRPEISEAPAGANGISPFQAQEAQWELAHSSEPFQTPEPEPEPEQRKTQEVQIAFTGKTGEGEERRGDVGFRSLLQSSRREQAARQAEEESVTQQQQAEEAARAIAVEEEIEWKKLFLSKQAGDNEFRKIKVCIVQREETLEQIALRYSLNPRELLIHNGLHESAVAEGQLLYIP